MTLSTLDRVTSSSLDQGELVASRVITDRDNAAPLDNAFAYSGQQYFYTVIPRVIYFSQTAATGTPTSISSDAYGIITMVIGSTTHKLYNVEMFENDIVSPIGDDDLAINAAVEVALALDLGVNLAKQNWTLNGPIDLTGVREIKASHDSTLTVTVDSNFSTNFPDTYAVFLGNQVGDDQNGRNNGLYLSGLLRVNASSRNFVANGIYVKGSWVGYDMLRASGFKGHGVGIEALWDSYINHISVELCGNPDAATLQEGAALFIGGADTVNTTHFIAIQCERSYQYAIWAGAHIRCQIDTIHSERTSVIDGTKPSYQFSGGNNTYGQAFIDQVNSSSAPDGTALDTTNPMQVTINEDGSTFGSWSVEATVNRTFGGRCTMGHLTVTNYRESDAATGMTFDVLECTDTFWGYNKTKVLSGSIGTVNMNFNAQGTSIQNAVIGTINYTSNILGGAHFSDCEIATVNDCRSGSTSNHGGAFTVFNDCRITTFNGAYNSLIQVFGGYITTASVASQCGVDFINVRFGTFGYTGNRSFITRGCSAVTVNNWSIPANNVSGKTFHAGETTQRLGYSAGANMYVNTAEGLNFAAQW